MLRLHRVVVCKDTLGFTWGGNIGSFRATLRVVWSDEGALYSSPGNVTSIIGWNV